MASTTSAPIIIKKYANRRLYDTSASRYVTLDHLRELVRADKEFQVVDAKSGEDLTRGVLAQIIFEEESKGETLLPVEFLRQLIGFYGDSMQSMVPGYLNMTMESFARQQAEMREKMAGAMTDPAASMALMEEAAKRNMAMFQQAMKMFTPGFPAPAAPEPKSDSAGADADMKALREELEAMRKRLDKLSGGR
ncbi:MAG: polyhydroxyalkanoate synthesis repressor PhaR [Oceanicaulis sp.]